jgi:hypothetical protein
MNPLWPPPPPLRVLLVSPPPPPAGLLSRTSVKSFTHTHQNTPAASE